MKIGVLALQGDFEMHCRMVEMAGAKPIEVREKKELSKVSGLIIPGGETTTMDRLLRSSGLGAAITERHEKGSLPVFGTCMGMILLGNEIKGFPELFRFGFIDMTVVRNAYGRQVDSFEADIKIKGMAGKKFKAVFIRAPIAEKVGGKVRVLAEHDRKPVLLAQGDCLAGSFHPELTDDPAVHRFFIERFVKK